MIKHQMEVSLIGLLLGLTICLYYMSLGCQFESL